LYLTDQVESSGGSGSGGGKLYIHCVKLDIDDSIEEIKITVRVIFYSYSDAQFIGEELAKKLAYGMASGGGYFESNFEDRIIVTDIHGDFVGDTLDTLTIDSLGLNGYVIETYIDDYSTLNPTTYYIKEV
jgi:hypothetical protein